MPELPEVETVCRGLKLICKNQRFARVKTSDKKLRSEIPRRRLQSLKGQKITKIYRRAKYLIFELETHSIVNHLGMSGSWRSQKAKETLEERPHDHVLIQFESEKRIIFNDPRRFGLLEVYKKGDEKNSKWLSHLGPEPLDIKFFNAEYLKNCCKKSRTTLKTLLMNQKVVVGVGNIYACEALFHAGVKPSRKTSTVTMKECERVVQCVRQTLEEAIRAGGSTIRDFRQAGGGEGYFQNQLYVYGRRQEDCHHCGHPIKTTVLTGRSTFHCPSCQK